MRNVVGLTHNYYYYTSMFLLNAWAQGPFPPWDKFHPEHFPPRTFSTLNFWTLSTPNFFHTNLPGVENVT